MPNHRLPLQAASRFLSSVEKSTDKQTPFYIEAYSSHKDQATAIACLQLFRSLGSEIGLAASAATIQRVLRSQLWDALTDYSTTATPTGPDNLGEGLGDVGDVINHVTDSLGSIGFLPPRLQEVVKGCYRVAIGWSLVLCLAFAILGAVVSFGVRERSLNGSYPPHHQDEEGEGREREEESGAVVGENVDGGGGNGMEGVGETRGWEWGWRWIRSKPTTTRKGKGVVR